MLPLTLIIGLFVWSNRIESYRIGKFNYTLASEKDRSGGFPKFPQTFLFATNLHQFYFPPKIHEIVPTHQPTCGTRSVHFTPKRSGKIIGGMYWKWIAICSCYLLMNSQWLQKVIGPSLFGFDLNFVFINNVNRSKRPIRFISMAGWDSNFQLRKRHLRASLWCGRNWWTNRDDRGPLHRGS